MYSRNIHIAIVSLYLLLAVFILRQPLFGNFGYEYAAVFALLGSIIAGFLAIRDERVKSDTRKHSRFWRGLGYNTLYIFVPVAAIFLASFPSLPCDPVTGISFFVLLPVVSVLFSYPLVWGVSLTFKWGRMVFIFLVVGTLLFWILSTYFLPYIFFYNAFLGYFPGLSYDRLLPVTRELILYRVFTLGVTFTITAYVFMLNFEPVRNLPFRKRVSTIYQKLRSNVAGILFTAGFIFFIMHFFFRGDMGWTTTRSMLENELGGKVETESFLIYYSPESFTEEELEWVALEHEFRLMQAVERLGVRHTPKIRSYLYPDEESKRRLIGPAQTNIAKPWSREIHINADRYQEVLLHEIIHVVAREFGMPVLRISGNMALMEGLAMDEVWGNRTLHEHAAAILTFDLMDSPEKILSNRSFATGTSSVSYVMAGSFVQFLIDRYGMERVKRAYPRSRFEAAFGRPREQLIREWVGFLRQIKVSDREELKTKYHFSRPSLFGIRCPRGIAMLNGKGWEYIRQEEYERAYETFGKSHAMVPNSSAVRGKILAAYRMEYYEEVMKYLIMPEFAEKYPQVIPILYRVAGDIYINIDKSEKGEEYYEKLLALDISESMNELAYLRILSIGIPAEEEDNWVTANRLFGEGSFGEAAAIYYRLKEIYQEPFARYRLSIRLGMTYYYQSMFQAALTEFWDGMNYSSGPASVYLINEWLDRTQFAEKRVGK